MARNVNINLNVEGDEAIKVVDALKQGIQDTQKASKSTSTSGIFDSTMVGKAFNAFKNGLRAVGAGFKTVGAAIKTSGLGLLALVITGIVKAFQNSEEGQNRFAKIMNVIGVITGNIIDVLADLGDLIIKTFENPKQAINDFVNLVKQNITNRIVGLIELFPKLGEAISLVFKGEFREAGRVSADAIAKVTLGVEDFSDKAVNAFNSATEAVKQFNEETAREIELAKQASDLTAETDKLERTQIVRRAKLEAQIAELRLKAREEERFSAEERAQFLTEANELQSQLLETDLEIARNRAKVITINNTFSRSTKENLNAEAEAIAQVSKLEATRFNQQRQIQRELNTINKQVQAQQKAARKEEEAAAQEELERSQDFNKELRKNEQEAFLLGIEDAQAREQQRIEFARENELAELERRLENEELTETQVQQLRESINDKFDAQEMSRIDKVNKAKVKSDNDAAQARLQSAKGFINVLSSIAGEESALGKAALIAGQAISIGEIFQNTAIANAKAVAAFPLTAGQPWVGINTATSIASIAGVIAQTAQQLGAFQSGGVVDGNSYFGDRVLARVNSGEMVLTREQQAELFRLANGRESFQRNAQQQPQLSEARIAQIAATVVASVPISESRLREVQNNITRRIQSFRI